MSSKVPQFSRPQFIFKTKDSALKLGQSTKIMGILNITPDSFSQDGLLRNKNFISQSLIQAKKFINDGADILDIGGESTRPGAQAISAEEESRRVVPVIKSIRKEFKIPLSIDTYKQEVAQAALDTGADIVNNIMGVKLNKSFLKMIKSYNAGLVLMHIRGTPRTMQKKTNYKNLINDIIRSLRESLENCFEIGIKSDKIILDPGIGFGKTPEQNLQILQQLKQFEILKQPILIGTSRKSFIGKILDKNVDGRIFGTTASVAVSILNGAHIIRVHDVKEMKEAALVTDAILNV